MTYRQSSIKPIKLPFKKSNFVISSPPARRTGIYFCLCVLQATAKASTKHEASSERESRATGWALIASQSLRA